MLANVNKEYYYTNGKMENYFDPETNITIPAFRLYYYGGGLQVQIYYVNGKIQNFFDTETNEVIPAYR